MASKTKTIETPNGTVAKAVPGWDGYFVDRGGDVYSTLRSGVRKLKPTLNAGGYPRVVLCRDGFKRSVLVHRVVASTYLGPCPDGMHCRHLDGDPANASLSNLRWGTPSENTQDKKRHGTIPIGEDCSWAKLSEVEVREIISDPDSPHTELAERYGVSSGMIMRIRQGLKWRHVERDPDAPVYESGRAALTEDDVRRIRFHTDGMQLSEIARRFGTTKSNVSRIKNGITWAHVVA